jgi:signal transduction histidine kinase
MEDSLEQKIQEARQCMGCMHEGLIVTVADGTIVETSLAAERILEAPSMSLKGKQVRTLYSTPSAYDELIRQIPAADRIFNRSVILLAGDDKKRKIVNMSVERVTDGDAVRYVHVFQDCADVRTLEERLLQSERLATVGKFASQIAHEIRNPLSSISLNIELLEDELKGSGDEARSLIRSVLKELDRLNDIVSEYLQFSRFPKPQLKRGHVDEVIHDVAQSLKLPESVKVELQLMSPSPEVWLDDRLLRQVLDNLARNGLEAMAGPGTLRFETDVVDRFLVIRVTDTGCGIPTDVQPKLFEPFFTTKPQGTGLGLATSQQIVFEHNGHLMVESRPGEGSTFTTLLPL